MPCLAPLASRRARPTRRDASSIAPSLAYLGSPDPSMGRRRRTPTAGLSALRATAPKRSKPFTTQVSRAGARASRILQGGAMVVLARSILRICATHSVTRSARFTAADGGAPYKSGLDDYCKESGGRALCPSPPSHRWLADSAAPTTPFGVAAATGAASRCLLRTLCSSVGKDKGLRFLDHALCFDFTCHRCGKIAKNRRHVCRRQPKIAERRG